MYNAIETTVGLHHMALIHPRLKGLLHCQPTFSIWMDELQKRCLVSITDIGN